MTAKLTPLLAVPSVEEALAYYRDVLGFETGFSMPGPDGRLVHGEAQYDGQWFMFGPLHDGVPAAARRFLGAGVTLYLTSDRDVDAYYAQVWARGATISEEIGDRFWGDRTFDVTDPWGYRITFAKHVRDVDFSKLSPAEMGTA